MEHTVELYDRARSTLGSSQGYIANGESLGAKCRVGRWNRRYDAAKIEETTSNLD
jgi:hypothetical protein